MPITLLLAIFKFDRMEWAIEKCTELNVTTIVPVVARRTEKHLALAAAKRVERWRRIAREAAEQSRRTSPPEISEPLKLKDALEQLHVASTAISTGFACHPDRGLQSERRDLRFFGDATCASFSPKPSAKPRSAKSCAHMTM